MEKTKFIITENLIKTIHESGIGFKSWMVQIYLEDNLLLETDDTIIHIIKNYPSRDTDALSIVIKYDGVSYYFYSKQVDNEKD